MTKQIIGRYDRANFPDLEIKDLKVKVDTGAYTSSLHATDIKLRKYKGVKHLYFRALDPGHPKYTGALFRCEDYTIKEVKSSSGHAESRYFIKTRISIFGKRYPIQLSLTDRSSMRSPVLLGRRFVHKRFIVDVSKTNVSVKTKLLKEK